MIRLQGRIDKNVVVACSGGVDSMAVADFLSRRHNVTLAFFHHGTSNCDRALEFLQEFVQRPENGRFVLDSAPIQKDRPKSCSLEEHWRNERYKYLHAFKSMVVTGHHLDDCVETWLWSSMHGEGKLIPYANGNVVRPFRLNTKQAMVNWCVRHNVPWFEDDLNQDTRFVRNMIRHEMMPVALKVNPGLHKVIKKKILSDGVRNKDN